MKKKLHKIIHNVNRPLKMDTNLETKKVWGVDIDQRDMGENSGFPLIWFYDFEQVINLSMLQFPFSVI